MKLEHHKEKVIPFRHFLIRLSRYLLFCGLLILISVLLGMFGYRYYAQLNWIDSFYMACMILTGMGPVATMENNTSKIFSSLYSLYGGVAFLSIAGIFLTPIVHRVLHILQVDVSDLK
jgi:hypothetical protein